MKSPSTTGTKANVPKRACSATLALTSCSTSMLASRRQSSLSDASSQLMLLGEVRAKVVRVCQHDMDE